jgi:hypothetical protein
MPAAQSESALHATAWQIISGTGVVVVVVVGGGSGAPDTVLPPAPQPA